MQRLKKLFKKEDGVSMVIVALMLTVLLAMAGLALDVGCAYYNKTKLQAACDAAALAAAQKLLDISTDDCTEIGRQCFDNNFTPEQLASREFDIHNDPDFYEYKPKDPSSVKNDTVTTRATMYSPTVFAKVLGFNGFDISVQATAYVTAGSSSGDALVTDEYLSISGGIPGNPCSFEGIRSGGIAEFNGAVEIDGDLTVPGKLKLYGHGDATSQGDIDDALSGETDIKIKSYSKGSDDFNFESYWKPVKETVDNQYNTLVNAFKNKSKTTISASYTTTQIPKGTNAVTSDSTFNGDLIVGEDGPNGGASLTINAGSTYLSFNGNLTVKKGSVLTINTPSDSGMIFFSGYDKRIIIEEGAVLKINAQSVTSASLKEVKCDGTLYCDCEQFQMAQVNFITSNDPDKSTGYIYLENTKYSGGYNKPPEMALSVEDRTLYNTIICSPKGTVTFSGKNATIYGNVYVRSFTSAAGTTSVLSPKNGDGGGRKNFSLIG